MLTTAVPAKLEKDVTTMSDAPSQRDAATAQVIVATAERLFRTLGYQKTTVGDIAKELNMSPANVYRFFDSKAALRDAVGRQLMGEVEHAVSVIARSAGPAGPRLRKAVLSMCAMNQARYLSDQKMHEMIAVALDESWGMVIKHVETIEQLITKICADGIASGEFKDMDPILAARCVKSAMISFCHPQLLEECADIPGPTAEEMMDFCLEALKKR
jgi:AcrR family transcriptional regulator